MIADGLTKDMDTEHMVNILTNGIWSISYEADLVNDRTRRKAASTKSATQELEPAAPPQGAA